VVALSELSEQQRDQAQRRFAVLRPHLDDGVSLTDAAAAAGIPARTARHWLARYRAAGLPGLPRLPRRDRDTRRQPPELVELVEVLALRRPRSSTAHIHRQTVRVAGERGWPAPSYGTVRSIVVALDPGLVALAHDGPAGYDRFELVFRREAAAANAIWQADHTQLDVMILDHAGRPARPWLTAILDDFSRRGRRLRRQPRRALSPADGAGAATGDLAQARPGLDGLRTARDPLQRPRLGLHEPPPRDRVAARAARLPAALWRGPGEPAATLARRTRRRAWPLDLGRVSRAGALGDQDRAAAPLGGRRLVAPAPGIA
jgi:transposase